MSKSKKSASVSNPTKSNPKKCARRYNGVPGANTTQRRPRYEDVVKKDALSGQTAVIRSTRSRLASRPLNESNRATRLCRKLGIRTTPMNPIKD